MQDGICLVCLPGTGCVHIPICSAFSALPSLVWKAVRDITLATIHDYPVVSCEIMHFPLNQLWSEVIKTSSLAAFWYSNGNTHKDGMQLLNLGLYWAIVYMLRLSDHLGDASADVPKISRNSQGIWELLIAGVWNSSDVARQFLCLKQHKLY